MKSKKPKIILIDGNAIVHRAFHALPPLTTKKGELVNAVFGFTSILLKAIKEIRPDYIAIAFDKKGPTFRHKIYKDYKATRQKAPEELYQQFPRIKEVVKAFNIPSFEMAGFEADDIIGTLSKKINIENIIVTGDLDILQLVDEDTKVYTMRKGLQDTIIYDRQAVQERYSLKPKQLIDFKALKGDPSDNIPGVPKVGEKTAIDLLKNFGTLEKVYLAVEKDSGRIKPRLKELLKQGKDQAFLSKELATIFTNVPIKLDLKKCLVKDFDREKVIALFRELGFVSLLKNLPKSEIKKQTKLLSLKPKKKTIKEKTNYQNIDSLEKLQALIEKLKKAKEFSFYLETTNQLSKINLLSLSFSFREKEAFFVPASKENLEIIKPTLENNQLKKIGHNIKKDIIALATKGINLAGVSFDNMIASYLLSPGVRHHELQDLIFSELGIEINKGIKNIKESNCQKADYIFRLKNILAKNIEQVSQSQAKTANLSLVFEKIEMPLIQVLAKMEINGIKINSTFLKNLSHNFLNKLGDLENKIYKLANTKFNINSSQQLSIILFKKLKIPTQGIKKTTTGFSTATPELVKLKDEYKIVKLVEQYREYIKLKTTYIDTLPELINSKTKRIHTSFNQTITATGRLSSSDPNLQNIPIRTKIGRQIRKAFIAEKGSKLLSADYSQIELRILAHISQDEKMCEAFAKEEDIHARTAAEVLEVDINEVTKKMRRLAKTVNFGIAYGMSPFGLAQTLGIEQEKAKKFINKYFEEYSGIKHYIEKTLEFARKKGFVETLFGRRRYLPEIKSSQRQVAAATERMAINMPIQGTAADIIKIAMNNLYKNNLVSADDIKLLLQVHDELVFEIKENKVEKMVEEIKKIMESAFKLCIPLRVNLALGDNWDEVEEITNI